MKQPTKKKTKKPLSRTPRASYSLDEECVQIINDEVAEAERQGFTISRSSVIRKALIALRAKRRAEKKTASHGSVAV